MRSLVRYDDQAAEEESGIAATPRSAKVAPKLVDAAARPSHALEEERSGSRQRAARAEAKAEIKARGHQHVLRGMTPHRCVDAHVPSATVANNESNCPRRQLEHIGRAVEVGGGGRLPNALDGSNF